MSAAYDRAVRLVRDIEAVLGDAAKGWADHGIPQVAAALSYYALLSVAPLLLVIVTIAGRLVSARAATAELMSAADRLAGELGTTMVEELLASASLPTTGTLLSALAFALAIFGAMRLFSQLRYVFDRIWNTPPERPKSASLWDGLRYTLRALALHNLRAFAMVLVIGVLLVATLALNTIVAAVTSSWFGVELPVRALELYDVLLSLVLLWAMFAAVYRVLPRVRLAWGDVAVGAAITAALFTLGRWLLGLYLTSSSVGSAFGAAGSLVVFLVWLNYSSQIILFGAELTRAWTYRFGSLARTGAQTPEPA